MKNDKPEAKGDPTSQSDSTFTNMHGPTGPKKDEAGDGIHQPSVCIPRQGELMPRVWG